MNGMAQIERGAEIWKSFMSFLLYILQNRIILWGMEVKHLVKETIYKNK